MKIEVGKTYVDRLGAHVQITEPNLNPDPGFRSKYPWVGLDADDAEYAFTEDGRFDASEGPYDLVAEAPAATEPPSELPGFGACPESEDATSDPEPQSEPDATWFWAGTDMAAFRGARGVSPLPEDSAARKRIPLCTGLLDYFAAALAAVATHSLESNEKHNPGEPMHWARGKSMDHPDCILRHLVDARAALDPRYHLTALAWRALAMLQEELEEHGAPVPPGAR
jgi:hypothetical protein